MDSWSEPSKQGETDAGMARVNRVDAIRFANQARSRELVRELSEPSTANADRRFHDVQLLAVSAMAEAAFCLPAIAEPATSISTAHGWNILHEDIALTAPQNDLPGDSQYRPCDYCADEEATDQTNADEFHWSRLDWDFELERLTAVADLNLVDA